jgi:hypothetical protein
LRSGRQIDVDSMPTVLEELGRPDVNADAKTQRTIDRVNWVGHQVLLNGRGAPKGIDRLTKCEEKAVPHGHDLLAPVGGNRTPDELKVLALNGLEIGAILCT